MAARKPRRKVRCPLCGARCANPKWKQHSLKQRQATARRLRAKGYTIRAIMEALGYRSPQSIVSILERKRA